MRIVLRGVNNGAGVITLGNVAVSSRDLIALIIAVVQRLGCGVISVRRWMVGYRVAAVCISNDNVTTSGWCVSGAVRKHTGLVVERCPFRFAWLGCVGNNGVCWPLVVL